MNGYSNQAQAQAAAQQIGGEVITAFDGSYLVRGAQRATDRSAYYQGADFAGYAGDLGVELETLLNGREVAQAPQWWMA